MKHLTSFQKKLMLDEITFYSICSNDDKEKIIGNQTMTFDDFRRLSLIVDYLNLKYLHQFMWDMYSDRFLVEMEKLYQKCEKKGGNIPSMLMETSRWMEDFIQQAPNTTVAYLLQEIFTNGLTDEE